MLILALQVDQVGVLVHPTILALGQLEVLVFLDKERVVGHPLRLQLIIMELEVVEVLEP
jgi:hypothetical protein